MTRRFSSDELTYLRNRVPVAYVVQNLLNMPARTRHGRIAFGCPICGDFDTAINAEHSLVRCFECRKNFNPIELVMHQLKIGFAESVKLLKKTMPTDQSLNTPGSASKNHQPVALGNVIADILPAKPDDRSVPALLQSISEIMADLQDNMRLLNHIIHELQSSIQQ